MGHASQIRPVFASSAYAENFRCIGSACEDTCCRGWTVPVDVQTWHKYQGLPNSPLQILIQANVVRNEPGVDGMEPTPANFAKIRMDSSNQCPILSEDGLCRIQTEFGAGMLSNTCATYPRIVHSFDKGEETALALSCPEAVRLVLFSPQLLDPDLLQSGPESRNADRPVSDAGNGRISAVAESPLPPDFWLIRSAVFNLVRNRAYPLWQRLFLLDLLCRRLDSIARGELDRSVADFLADFAASAATGALRGPLESLPTDGAAQLDVVLRLAGLMLHKSNVTPRFIECVQAFTAGIGNGPGATLEILTAQYGVAHDRFFAPFVARHPYLMENFLINTILRCQFPFGKEAMRTGSQPARSREFAQLAAQFALMRGLLIGVSGFHGPEFSAAHVVHTVQAASKHFEHHPKFPSMAHSLLKESGMDSGRGLAILLRDAGGRKPDRAASEATPATPGIAFPIWPGGTSA